MFDMDVLDVSTSEDDAADASVPDGNTLALDPTTIFNHRISNVPRGPAITLPPDASVGAALAAMRHNHRGAAVVVRGQSPVGVVSDRDILMHVSGDIDELQSVPVSALMVLCPVPLFETDTVAAALRSMCGQRRWHLPIVCKRNLLIGALDVVDLTLWLRDRLTLASVVMALGDKRV